MVVEGVHVRKRLLLAFFLFLFLTVNGENSEPDYMVIFPAVIEAGSNANLCISFLNPTEALQLEIFLVHENQNATLLQETVEKEFHRCTQFKAPLVKRDSKQNIKVRVKSENFEMSQTKEVLFKSYNPVTFIQTDKPIYNPGQTVNMRVVTMNADLIPIEEVYSSVIIEDTNKNIIAQWLNVSSKHLLLELSHKLNPEALLGQYQITSNVGKRKIFHHFKVEQYVLPKFEITVTVKQETCVEEDEIKLKVCGKYTYEHSVAGRAKVKVCRNFRWDVAVHYYRVAPCLYETLELKEDGCGSLTVNVSTLMNSEIKNILSDIIRISAEVIEEGTDISLFKTASTRLTYQIGEVHFIDLPKNFERGKVIEGKIKVTSFRGTPIPNKEVYLLDDELRPPKVLLSLSTDSNGLASFTINAPDEPKTQIQLAASIYKEKKDYYRSPHFSRDQGSVSLLNPSTVHSPVPSVLSIEASEETFKCGIETQININYLIIGETNKKYSINIVYMVLSKGAIVHHGYETVHMNESADVRKGAVSFTLSVSAEFSPTVQILAYSVLPSKNVIAASSTRSVENCFKNKVSLQFSPSNSVPGEKNTLELSAHPGSLCALSAVDQSVFILESEGRLMADKIFNMMPKKPRTSIPPYVNEELVCAEIIPRTRTRTRRDTNDKTLEIVKRMPESTITSFPDMVEDEVVHLQHQPREVNIYHHVQEIPQIFNMMPVEYEGPCIKVRPRSGKIIDSVYETLKIFDTMPKYMDEGIDACIHLRPRTDKIYDHVYETLESLGLKMASNFAFRMPRCLAYQTRGYEATETRGYYKPMRPIAVSVGSFEPIQKPIQGPIRELIQDPIQSVRKFFPETWIWQLVKVGESGTAQVPETVPDTITTWETETFCLSSVGLGLAPPVTLTVFQPFFLELSLPYSIIRGEVFELKATVFNYLPKCIMVKVTPAPSPHYTLEALSDVQYSSCLCAKGRKTFKWTLISSVLGTLNVTVSAEAEQSQTLCDNEIVSVPERGRIDTVTRSLLVKAEGTEKSKSQSWLLCPQGKSVSEEVELSVPENVVEGSARAYVSVLGDILGHALKNLDGLLKMPYGCGEQNMALLSPNIYILQYLENTQQLTPKIRAMATEFLKSGYQRQLNYKHYDGSYSTFGKGQGNTWLTAFVLRNFGKAQRYVFIDPKIINSAKEWLIKGQGTNGCFISQGKLFHNRMKGGVNDDVTMTAYITASFLELGYTVTDSFVKNGLLCLQSSVGNITNTYTTALLAYTFSLAGKTELRQQLLNELDSVAASGDGRLHWSQSASEDSQTLSVEISSYVLLAVLTTDQLSAADLGYATKIVSWLVKQQNPYGGFSSTQDTVVALQALALYATKVFSLDGSSTVTVTSAGGDSRQFDVNQNNSLLYQEKSLQDVSGKYSIEVEGFTCVSVQMAQVYNVPAHAEPNTLSIKATASGTCTSALQTILLEITVKYSGTLEQTNMLIMDITLLSGFTANYENLKYMALVGRIDAKDDHVIIYLKELKRNMPIHFLLEIKQVLPVKNIKPAVIKIYDYYEPSDNSEAFYTSPCQV